ncbi:MAG: VCBS repeat-containing protein [Planctomycetes bacterium]|nr:VCBS repeat-containing protein [Planctomycetota bacterium]
MKYSTQLLVVALPLALVAATGCSSQKKKRSSNSTTAATTSNSTGNTNSSSSGGTNSSSTGTPATNTPIPVGGTGVFTDGSAALPASTQDDWAVASGDVDGDGRADLLIAPNGGVPRLLLNRPTGFTAASFPAVTIAATDAALVDMNNDGNLDAVISANYEPVRVFRGDGAGGFTLLGEFPAVNDALVYKIAIGDVDGDNDPDVVLARAGQNTTSQGADLLLLNDGTGTLVDAPAGALPALTEDSLGVALFDLDKDGDLDLYLANFGIEDRVYLNDGAGVFTDASALVLPAGVTVGGATAVTAGDVNGDGFMDVVVANEGLSVGGNPPAGEANLLLLNDGAGRLQDASVLLPADADASFDVVLVDVNGDNALDLFVANLRAVQRLYLNSGNGVFTDATANLSATNTGGDSFSMTVGDFNADRAVDVLFVRRQATPWLFLNTPR